MHRYGPTRVVVVLLLVATVGCRTPAAAPEPAAPVLPTSATAGGTSIVAIAPPAQQCCPKQTLPQFLGITGAVHGICGLLERLRNHLGTIWPGLEAKPEVLAISDPANLESPNPAVAAAAGVKAEEDAAAQKAKAIAYLASVGCAGCYPGIEEALLAALDDCSEIVRFETAKALRSTAAGPCKNCCRSACCGPEIRKKLESLAYELDEQGCYIESSDRVRRMARLALANCTCVPLKPNGQTNGLPSEGPEPAEGVAEPVAMQPTAPAMPTGVPEQAVGSGVATTAIPSAPPHTSSTIQPTSYDQVLRSYSSRDAVAQDRGVEVQFEVYSARHASFASRSKALAIMTLARAHLLSPQAGPLPSPLGRNVHGWTNPATIPSPPLARAVATTPEGGVSTLVEDHAGWHLVRVLARRPAPVPTIASQAAANPPPAAANGTASPVSYQHHAAQAPVAAAGPANAAPMGARPRPAAGSQTMRLPDCNCP